MDSTVFYAQDPDGNQVRLSTDRKTHIESHEELIGAVSEIQNTIENPNVISKDKDFPESTKNYYREHNNTEYEIFGSYLKVPVDFSKGSYSGEIKTAFFVDNVHQRDEIIWIK